MLVNLTVRGSLGQLSQSDFLDDQGDRSVHTSTLSFVRLNQIYKKLRETDKERLN